MLPSQGQNFALKASLTYPARSRLYRQSHIGQDKDQKSQEQAQDLKLQ